MQRAKADISSFKAALASFAAGVCVITVRDESGRPSGMTATAFCSVSLEPLLVLVSLNRSTRTHRRVLSSGLFGVNVLGRQAQAVAEHCSRPGAQKLLATEWLADGDDTHHGPALAGALAYLDCEVYRHFPAGTHGIVIGLVRAIGLGDEEQSGVPLVHYRGGYCELGAVPALG